MTQLHIDFLSKQMTYRRQHAGLRKELVARAMGAKPSEDPKIVDATAGLGRDSFILASLGFHITMLERSPVIYQHLADAMERAKLELAEIIARMQLIQTDAISWLSALPEGQRPEIVYLDPMFPERKKSASVKKDMVIMQELLGKDDDFEVLFKAALCCATRRVVVKRPKLAPNFAEKAANFSINGKSSRFDVYLV